MFQLLEQKCNNPQSYIFTISPRIIAMSEASNLITRQELYSWTRGSFIMLQCLPKIIVTSETSNLITRAELYSWTSISFNIFQCFPRIIVTSLASNLITLAELYSWTHVPKLYYISMFSWDYYYEWREKPHYPIRIII